MLRVRGYRFFFFSMEGREPPHIHVAHAGVRSFRGHQMTEIRQIVVENARFFLEEWHEYFDRKS